MVTSLTRLAVLVGMVICIGVAWLTMALAAENEKWSDVSATKPKGVNVCYTVCEGDNLSEIAKKFDVSLSSLLRANKLKTTVIYPGNVLLIPGRAIDAEQILSRGYSREDLNMLARAIYAEARGECFEGQVAVGAVILNRVKHKDFPKSIREVVMQNNRKTYQFTPVQDGTINLEPDEVSYNAAAQAMLGWDPTEGALYFYNPITASDMWIRTLPVMGRIGNHVFAANKT